MLIECKVGTPAELETKTYSTTGPAKTFVRGRMQKREKWADRFNHELKRRVAAAREEFDNLDLKTISEGETRQWQVTDEVTNVTFVWKVKMVQK